MGEIEREKVDEMRMRVWYFGRLQGCGREIGNEETKATTTGS